METRTAIFFDVDGTILDMKGAGRRAFILALKEAFGWDDAIEYISFAGATDLDVLARVAEQQGATVDEAGIERFFDVMPGMLEKTAAEEDMVIFPGVKRLLEALAADDAVALGLITGNIESCAHIKLRQFELHDHFLLGAFGHEHADRNGIARLAADRMQQLFNGEPPAAMFLVGDTPSDITAAKHIGAQSVAVATGTYDAASLREAGADHVLEDLSDTPHVLELLGMRRIKT